MKRDRSTGKFVICVSNEDYEASLQLLKIYERIPDARGEWDGLVRVVDEDGEGYLYPAEWFIPLDVPRSVERALESVAELQSA